MLQKNENSLKKDNYPELKYYVNFLTKVGAEIYHPNLNME